MNFIPPTKDPSAYKMIEFDGKDTLVKEAQISTVEFPVNISDDEPLSVWFEAVKTAHATSKLVYILNEVFHMYCHYFWYSFYLCRGEECGEEMYY